MTEDQPTTDEDELVNTPSPTAMVVAALMLMVAVFSLTVLVTLGWNNRAYLIDLMYESNMEKYLVAIGESGPATFHVYHQEFSALEKMALESDEILGVEVTKYPGVAAMAFTASSVPAIAMVREHPLVSKMRRRNIPMLCH